MTRRHPIWLVLFLVLAQAGCSRVSQRLVAWKKSDYRDQAHLEQKSVEVAGHQVVYLDRGGSGEPMVLVHGFGGDKDNWTLMARCIPATYRVIALDLPGFGESSRVQKERYDVRAQSQRLLAFVDAIGVQRFHLAGNSMGGNIAGRFAIDHPERVRSLALVNSGGVVSPHPSEVAVAFAAGKNPLVLESPEDFERMMTLMFVKQPPIPGFVKRSIAERAFANRPFNEKVFADLRAQPDRLEGELGRIQAPTWVVWGDHDRIIDVSAADVFAAGIHGAKKTVLTECGHAPMIERPEETAQRYVAFLASKGP